MTQVHIEYYALLREKTGKNRDTLQTEAKNLEELYRQLQRDYDLPLKMDQLRVAKNDTFCDWNSSFNDNDTIIFIPPVAGG